MAPSNTSMAVLYYLAILFSQTPTLNAHRLDSFMREASLPPTLTVRDTANLQSFSSALGGFSAAPITESSDPTRPFEVGGNTFPDFADAGERSCATQFNSCQQAANEQGTNFSVSDCTTQQTQCGAAQDQAPMKAFTETSSSSNSNDSNSSNDNSSSDSSSNDSSSNESSSRTSSSSSSSSSSTTIHSSTQSQAAQQTTISTSAAPPPQVAATTEQAVTSSAAQSSTPAAATTAAAATADLLPSIPAGFDLVCGDGTVLGSA